MKKNILILIFSFFYLAVYSQISIPVDDGGGGSADPCTIVRWWQEDQYTIFAKDPNSNATITYTPVNPFEGTANIENNDALEYQQPKDYEYCDGWRVLRKHFGTQNEPVDAPHFMLYNKYTGMVRIFVFDYRHINQGVNTGLLSIYSNNYENLPTMFDYLSAEDYVTALDYQSPLIVNSVDLPQIVFQQFNDFWLYGEFTATYDPCRNRDDILNFEFHTFQEFDFNLTASGEIIFEYDENGITSTEPNGTFQFNNAFDIIGSSASTFNSSQSAIKLADKLFDLGLSTSTMGTFGIISAVGKGLSLLINSFDKSDNTSGSTLLKSGKLNLDANGTITNDIPELGFSMDLPGNNFYNSQIEPDYDYPLGVFNLLETPTAIVAREMDWSGGDWDPDQKQYVYFTDEIKYIINSYSGFGRSYFKIYGAIEVEYGGSYNWDNISPLVDESIASSKKLITEFIPLDKLNDKTYFKVEKHSHWLPPVLKVVLKIKLEKEKNGKTITHIVNYICNKQNVTYEEDVAPSVYYSSIPPSYSHLLPVHSRNYPDDLCSMYDKSAKSYDNLNEISDSESVNLELSVYPNPSKGQFSLQLTGEIDRAEYFIYNAMGEEIIRNNVAQNIETVDISDYPVGIYLIKVVQNGNVQTKTVIKN